MGSLGDPYERYYTSVAKEVRVDGIPGSSLLILEKSTDKIVGEIEHGCLKIVGFLVSCYNEMDDIINGIIISIDNELKELLNKSNTSDINVRMDILSKIMSISNRIQKDINKSYFMGMIKKIYNNIDGDKLC